MSLYLVIFSILLAGKTIDGYFHWRPDYQICDLEVDPNSAYGLLTKNTALIKILNDTPERCYRRNYIFTKEECKKGLIWSLEAKGWPTKEIEDSEDLHYCRHWDPEFTTCCLPSNYTGQDKTDVGGVRKKRSPTGRGQHFPTWWIWGNGLRRSMDIQKMEKNSENHLVKKSYDM